MAGSIPAERAFPTAGLALFVSLFIIVLSFVPVVPPEDAMQGGGTTLRGGIEFGLILAGIVLLGIYSRAWESFAFDLRAPSFLLISLFAFWAIISSIWSPNPVLTIAKGAELWCATLAAAMCVQISRRAHIPQEKLSALLATALVLLVACLLVMNLFIWGTLLPTIGDASLPLEIIGEEVDHQRARLILAYSHPLLTGDVLALTIIAIFASSLKRFWKLLLFPGLVFLLWMADARGPTGGLLIALLAMGLLKLRRNDLRAIALMLMVSVCLGVAMIFQESLPKFFTPFMTDDVSTLNSRTELWARALSYIPERPIAGFGYYSTRYLLMKEFQWAGHAHNSFIEVALTTGLIGFLMLCAFVAYLFRSILKTKNALLLGVTIYSLIQGMLNPLLFYAGLPMFVIALGALSADWTSRRTFESE